MPKLPVLRARDVIAVLHQLNFSECVDDIPPNLLRKIIDDIKITPEEFLRHL